MIYHALDRLIALQAKKNEETEQAIKNYLALLVSAVDESDISYYSGIIESLEDCKSDTLPELFEKLSTNKTRIANYNNEDSELGDAISYYEGYIDGIRRLIKIDKEIYKTNPKSLLVIYCLDEIFSDIFSICMKSLENRGIIFDYNSENALGDNSLYCVSADISEIKQVITQYGESRENIGFYIMAKSSESKAELSEINDICNLCKGNMYLIQGEKLLNNKAPTPDKIIMTLLKKIAYK